MRISFDVVLGLQVNHDGSLKLIIKYLDHKSVHIPDRYIKAFSGKVHSAARDTIKEMSGDLVGYALSEKLPLPQEVAGIPLVYKKYKADESGHIILYFDMRI